MPDPRLELQAVRAAVERRLARGPAQLADGFARWVRNSPEDRLRKLMSSPFRGLLVELIFRQMPRHFQPAEARGTRGLIRWEVWPPDRDGTSRRPDVYELQIEGERCHVARGRRGAEPRVTIGLDALELVRLATGTADPIQAYLSGRVKLAGDVMLAAELRSLFRVPGRTPVPQSVSTVSSSR